MARDSALPICHLLPYNNTVMMTLQLANLSTKTSTAIGIGCLFPSISTSNLVSLHLRPQATRFPSISIPPPPPPPGPPQDMHRNMGMGSHTGHRGRGMGSHTGHRGRDMGSHTGHRGRGMGSHTGHRGRGMGSHSGHRGIEVWGHVHRTYG